ncbi:MAG: sensor histidine kinase, partial [Chitinophagaceae bacterium]
ILFSIFFILLVKCLPAQVVWSESDLAFKDINWFNYATSYAGVDEPAKPTIVTAIPYNGVYTYFDNTWKPQRITIDSSLFNFNPGLIDNSLQFSTYDSSDVYFLAPGIYSNNAINYEYRIILNGQTVVKPWTAITRFADNSFQLNNFKKGMAFLGGYKTTWNNLLIAQIRNKTVDSILSFSAVTWEEIKPALLNIYPSGELNGFLARLKKSWDNSLTREEQKKWQSVYSKEEIDPFTHLPKKLILPGSNNNIIFYLQGDIYKKEALEYQLEKDSKIKTKWKSNDFDNNLIWLQNLSPGEYLLNIRYGSQRHNTISYPFRIKPFWYQRPVTRMIFVILAGLLFFLIYRLWKQKQITRSEKLKKEKLHTQLKSLRAQLNPHFVFNALGSIQGLINNNQIDNANHYLTEFSSLLRESLKNKDAENVPLSEEVKLLETYLSLEQLRFHFKYTISVQDSLPANEIEIPSLLIQPLVENAIKHGAGPLYEKGVVEIHFSINKSDFRISIVDNGSGYAASSPSNGFGINLVKERIMLLNESLSNQKIHLSFESNKINHTSVQLIFENWF